MDASAVGENKNEKSGAGALRTSLIFAALFFLYLWRLGDAGLMEPDEGRYAEIPRNMIATGDYITPRLNGLKYFEKPVLCYWMSAAAFRILGENNFAARLPSALLALAGVTAMWAAARKMYGRDTADWSAVVLGTSLLYYAIGRIDILDMPLSAFITLSMAAAWLAIRERERENRWLLLFFASMGLSVLTKGLIGIVLPGGILFCYALIAGRVTLLWRFARFLPGYALFAVLTVPWFWAVCSRNPDFFRFFFIHEHFLRYTTEIHDRMEPFWFFLPILMAGFIPWLGFLPGAVRDAYRGVRDHFARHGGKDCPELYLLCWCFFILLFFSASHSKLIPYIVPAMPPLAILMGRAIALRANPDGRRPGIIPAAALNALILLALAVGFLLLPRYFQDPQYDVKLAWRLGRVIALALILLACLTVAHVKRAWAARFAILVPAAAMLLMFTIQPIALVAASGKSTYDLCLELKDAIGPDDIIINYEDFIQGPQFYLGRRIVLVEYTGELAYGKDAEPESARAVFMTKDEFERFIDTPTSGDKIVIFEDERGKDLPPFAVRGAIVAAVSHNFTAVRLRR